MRNVFMVLTVLLLLTACGEETTIIDNGGAIIPPVSENAYVTTASVVGIIKNSGNSKGIYYIGGISKSAGDTVTITFDNTTEADYTVTKGFFIDDSYSISLQYNKQAVAAAKLNLSVKNRNGVEIMNSPVYLFTVNKIHPIDVNTNVPTTILYDFTTTKTQTIVLEKYSNEYTYSFGDGTMTGGTSSSTATISSYGFTNTNNGETELDNSSTSGGYTVDVTTPEFTVANQAYPNCLASGSSIKDTKCALNVTYKGAGGDNTTFYIRTRNKDYTDTALYFRSNIN